MSDKENVSIDEMMDNLKRKERGARRETTSEERSDARQNGELVTRADGSKAIKVKSRKRRSQQPKKEAEKSNTKRNVIVIGSLVLLLLLGGIAYTMLLAYYNGNTFQDKVVESVQNASGAEVELGSMEVKLTSAKANKMDLKWEDSVLKNLALENVYVEYGLTAFIGGGWSGKEITASKATLKLGMMKSFENITSSEKVIDAEFEKIRSSDSSVRFGKSKTWRLDGVALTLENENDSFDTLHLHGGTLKSVLREDLTLSSGTLDFNEDTCDVVLRLAQQTGPGTIILEGVSGYVEGSEIAMGMKLDSSTLTPFLSSGVRRLFDGVITSEEGDISMKLGDDDVEKFTINVESGELRVKEFAFIRQLKVLIENAFFTTTKFTESKCVINYDNGMVAFTDLELEAPERMRITGNVTVAADGAITGNLKVGVSYEMIADSANSEELATVFTRRDSGYAWADAKLGGELGKPSDDLAVKLEALNSVESGIDGGSVIPKGKSPDDLIEELNQ